MEIGIPEIIRLSVAIFAFVIFVMFAYKSFHTTECMNVIKNSNMLSACIFECYRNSQEKYLINNDCGIYTVIPEKNISINKIEADFDIKSDIRTFSVGKKYTIKISFFHDTNGKPAIHLILLNVK